MRGRRWGAFGALGAAGAAAITTIVLATSGPARTANLWVNTTAGASPTRCVTACVYDSAKAYGSFASACAAASAGDFIGVVAGTYSAQTITRTNCNPASPVTIRAMGSVTINGDLVLGADGTSTAPDYITFDGNYETTILGTVVVAYSGSGAAASHDAIENSHIVSMGNSGHLVAARDVSYLTVSGNEIGPGCCGGGTSGAGDGIEIGIRGSGNPNNDHVSIVGNYIHDLYDSCSEVPTYITNQYACSGTGFGDTGTGDHVDGMQVYGSSTLNIERNRVYLQGDHKQGIFLQTANGGSFSNITIENNMVSSTSDNTVSLSGPGTSVISGFVHVYYNTILGSFYLYNSIVTAGTPVVIAGNILEGPAGNQSGGGCTMTYGDSSTLTPTWKNNLLGTNNACDATDKTGSPTVVQATFPGAGTCNTGALTGCQTATGDPNLNLSGAQTAINGGEATYCPPTDLHSTVRPQGAACDIGADEAS